MSVSKVSEVTRVEPPTPLVRRSDDPERSSSSEPQSSNVTHKFIETPEPRRFPWLSWETRDLATASKQPSPYGNIALLGKELDQTV